MKLYQISIKYMHARQTKQIKEKEKIMYSPPLVHEQNEWGGNQPSQTMRHSLLKPTMWNILCGITYARTRSLCIQC